MSQHDLVIDNGPGVAVRTDIVAALQALVTLSSGPLPPVTTYAGMWWLDTSVTPNGSLKMRNLSNTDWTFPSIYGDDRVGEIAFYARPTPPAGWLKANGATISRTTYAALFAAIGTQFGIGDGVNTFEVPDLRGRFIRAWDDSAGNDPSRAFGSLQADGIRNHTHPATTTVDAGGSHAHTGWVDVAGWHGHSGWTDGQGEHAHSIFGPWRPGSGGISHDSSVEADAGTYTGGFTHGSSAAGNHGHNIGIGGEGNHQHSFTSYAAAAHAHTASTTVNVQGGAADTRPPNVSMLACIRYA